MLIFLIIIYKVLLLLKKEAKDGLPTHFSSLLSFNFLAIAFGARGQQPSAGLWAPKPAKVGPAKGSGLRLWRSGP